MYIWELIFYSITSSTTGILRELVSLWDPLCTGKLKEWTFFRFLLSVASLPSYVWRWICKRRQTRTHTCEISQKTEDTFHTVDGPRFTGGCRMMEMMEICYLDHDLDWGIGWSPQLGGEKSHYVNGWILVCKKPGVLSWRIHTDYPRLEVITVCLWGFGDVCVRPCVVVVVLVLVVVVLLLLLLLVVLVLVVLVVFLYVFVVLIDINWIEYESLTPLRLEISEDIDRLEKK